MHRSRSSSVVDNKFLFEQVFKIIDSKIKFLEYQTNQIISQVDFNNFKIISVATTHSPRQDSDSTGNKILDMIETYSRSTSILLKLRTKLTIDNAILVFDLLNQEDLFKKSIGELDTLLHTPQNLAKRLFS